MLVELVRAREQPVEILRADRQRDRQPDSRPERIASPDPVPDREPLVRRNPEIVHRPAVGRDGDALRGNGRIAAVLQQPLACGIGVCERLKRRERFRADDEQRRLGVCLPERMCERDAVDIRYATDFEPAERMFGQGSDGHDDAEIGAANADIDDRVDRPACRTSEFPAV